MLCMPVSGPWYEWLTSLIISSAVRRSPGANGWFHAVKMYSSGSGHVCYRRNKDLSAYGRRQTTGAGRKTHSSNLMQLALDREAE